MRTPSTLAYAMALALFVAAGSARAQDPGSADEVVTLKSGAVYRGQLVEKVPGSHVSVRLASGEIRKVAWADVQRSASATVASGGAANGAAAPGTTGTSPEGPRLTIESDDPQTSLFQLSESGNVAGVVAGRGYHGGYESWRSACVAPCNAVMDPKLTYRVGGIGITPSSPFVLPQSKESVVLRVRTGSAFWHDLGGSLTWTGVSLVVLGAIVTGVSFALESPSPGEPDVQGTVRTAGLIGLGVGGGLVVSGLPMLIVTGTSVHADGRSLARRPGVLTF